MQDADITVVGGGLAGLVAAAVAAHSGARTVHLSPPASPDRRTSALMMPSVEILCRLGLLDTPDALGHPLTSIRIIDATRRLIRAPETFFESSEAGLEAFGCNFSNAALNERFAARLAGMPTYTRVDQSATSIAPTRDGTLINLADGTAVRTRLLVGADGKASSIRKQGRFSVSEAKFDVSALVCDLDLERPIGGTSYEFHYEDGPFTLVPAGGNRANLVWIDRVTELEAARSRAQEDLARLFEEKCRHLFGKIGIVSPVFIFPLSSLLVAEAGKEGIVLVGEAAHAFPPIGAQGLNLGLRDADDLDSALQASRRTDAGWAQAVSIDYARRRAIDIARTGGIVSTLFHSLLSDFLPLQAIRAAGFWGLRGSALARRGAFNLGMGR